MSRLLVIYDADDWKMRLAARTHAADHAVPVRGGVAGLVASLDRLVETGLIFDRAVFVTRGGNGGITFNRETLDAARLRSLDGRGYERLFPSLSRLHFAGCNVAGGDAGWTFLRAAGALFLRQSGGEVFAHADTERGAGQQITAVITGLLVLLGLLAGRTFRSGGDAGSVYFIASGRPLWRSRGDGTIAIDGGRP